MARQAADHAAARLDHRARPPAGEVPRVTTSSTISDLLALLDREAAAQDHLAVLRVR